MLLANPNVTCGSPQHHEYLVWSCLGIIVYVIGIPLFFWKLLRRGRQQNSLISVRGGGASRSHRVGN